MKFYHILIVFIISYILSVRIYDAIIISISIVLLYKCVIESNSSFVFREFTLLLYAVNYLIAPAITYRLPDEDIKYGMKIPYDSYFDLALPGFLLLSIGMYVIPTNVFKIKFKNVRQAIVVNKKFLISTTIFGLALSLPKSLPGELGFIVYLLSLLRFVGAFALLTIDKKLWYWSAIVIVKELILAFINGMYHDLLMWLIFFGLFSIYALKPSIRLKLLGVSTFIIFIFFIQAVKYTYRAKVWNEGGEANLSTVYEVAGTKTNSEQIFDENNLLGTLNRGNQAWIFASTVKNLNTKKNFAGLKNVNKYLEAAILPRFMAPNKITSGDQEIFNEYSGHVISNGTAMGLGVFADGYIAYGTWGVYIFGFLLGLIFALTFKLVERWTKVSPFYVLLLLPLLIYAVRPDCELQTTINHLFKGILLYGFLVYLTRKRFTLDSQENQRKLLHLNLATTKK